VLEVLHKEPVVLPSTLEGNQEIQLVGLGHTDSDTEVVRSSQEALVGPVDTSEEGSDRVDSPAGKAQEAQAHQRIEADIPAPRRTLGDQAGEETRLW